MSDFDWSNLLKPEIVWAPIAVLAILIGGITSIIKQCHRHSERMAMIDQGMHPDDESAKIEGQVR